MIIEWLSWSKHYINKLFYWWLSGVETLDCMNTIDMIHFTMLYWRMCGKVLFTHQLKDNFLGFKNHYWFLKIRTNKKIEKLIFSTATALIFMIPVDSRAPPSWPPVPEVSPSSAALASSSARFLHPLGKQWQIRSGPCVNKEEIDALIDSYSPYRTWWSEQTQGRTQRVAWSWGYPRRNLITSSKASCNYMQATWSWIMPCEIQIYSLTISSSDL